VVYHVSEVPDGSPAIGTIEGILDGSANERQRDAFTEVWNRRVQVVLTNDSLFTVEPVSSG
jgi:hypothetical protein